MADFDKAWKFTRSWEGCFSITKGDIGDYFNRDKDSLLFYLSNDSKFDTRKYKTQYGTAWGVTIQMIFDYVDRLWIKEKNKKTGILERKFVINGFQKDEETGKYGFYTPVQKHIIENSLTDNRYIIKELTEQQAKNIWKQTAWRMMRGDLIQNQDIATIIFDAFVRANDSAVNEIPKNLGLNIEKCKDHYLYYDKDVNKSLNTRKPTDHKDQKTQKYWYFNDYFIQELNKKAAKDPKGTFDDIKKALVKHVDNRRNAFIYGKLYIKPIPECDQTTKGQKRKIVNETEKTNNTGLYIGLGLLALWVLKRRRKA